MLSRIALQALLATTVAGASLQRRDVWQPEVGAKWQIDISNDQLSASGLLPSDAQIWDVDVFNTPASLIASYKAAGKKVICYFSAGTSENWRPDFSSFTAQDQGADLPDWPGEKWLDLRSDNVWNVQQKRIQMAAEAGCDGIDPDNMDGYSNQNGGGFSPPLSQEDSVTFMQKMAGEAAKYGMAIGLKNALDIIPAVTDIVQFAVNEQCVANSECNTYDGFLNAGKPVFHIEYGDASSLSSFCLQSSSNAGQFSTIVKHLALDFWALYCDGTSVGDSSSGGDKKRH